MRINENQKNYNSGRNQYLESSLWEYFYTHRARGSLNYFCSLPQNILTNKLVNIVNSRFTVKTSNKLYSNFIDHTYSPLDVRIPIRKNGTGKQKPRHWAYFDYVKGVIHVDGEYPQQRIQEFLTVLKDNGIDLTIEKSNYTYVEVCCRHPHHTFDKVSEAISRLAHRFSVPKTIISQKNLTLTDEVYEHIAKDLFLNGYCNLKTYKYVNKFGSSNPSINKHIEPKLEIQINNPKTLKEAHARGVSILKAITASLGVPIVKMDRDFEKSEYTEIPNSEKYSPNEKITSFLNERKMNKLPSLPEAITKHPNSYNIVNSIYFIPKRTDQLITELNVSESTIRRTIKRLGNLIEKRGDRKNGYLLIIDKTKLNNNTQSRGVIKHIGNSSKNKGKVLGITLLLIIGANILFSYYFSPFYLKTPEDFIESFSLRKPASYSFFNSNRNSVSYALMNKDNFSLTNKPTKDLEQPSISLIISEFNRKEVKTQ